MKNYKFAVIPGDGTGPEVTAEALKVLAAAGRKFNFSYVTETFNWGGENYLATGEVLPEDATDKLKKFDAALLGAIGHPKVKPGILEKGILLKLRFDLDQYINLRPVKLFPGVETPLANKKPEDIDYVVVRENVGGLYTGIGGFTMKGTDNETAVQSMVYTRKQVERAIRFSFELANKRHSKAAPWRGLKPEDIAAGKTAQLTLCGKTNVLTYVFDLWERVFYEVAAEYPHVKTDYAHVDATTMWMVKNPEWFDVIVTENMFGDIITDLGAMTQGGMGIAAGGNINPNGVSMFEPIGGSAPKYTGMGVINPLAAVLAAGMMIEHLGECEAATAIEKSVAYVTGNKLKSMAAGKMGYSTAEVGDLVVANL
ncbi:MAG: 3-isopropylmalate dehydrogenase [Victivallaceae bacterium]|nr:3-isopropylmalate dehydrogenase [Victivallaceae bacterium]MDD4317081.1 3-isopropylmalate dehydrogenase [Victivallaceae bacterium]NLK82974.1 3-isopropylmalate dehydrogenase [Lentisphaerota bacterium]